MDGSGTSDRGRERGADPSDAVEAIYRATGAPELWPDALEAIADAFGDVGTNLVYVQEAGSVGLISSPRLEAARRAYEDGWWQHDIRIQRALERGYPARNDAWTDQELVTDEEIESHPYYARFLASHGLRWSISTTLSPDPRALTGLALQRAASKPAYVDSEVALFTRLARHVEHALRLGIRLTRAEVAQGALGEALARLDAGVFLVDSRGRAVAANSTADRLVGAALTMVDGRLTPRVGGDSLERAIAETTAWEGADGIPDPRPIVLRSERGDAFHVAYVLPVSAREHDPFARLLADVRALVLVLRSLPGEPPEPTLVRDLLDLTLGEARVASLVGAGLPPREAGRRLGVTEETARTTLKRVFSKTGVSRQSELAVLLARMVR